MPAAEHQPDFAPAARLFGAKVRHAFDEREMTQRQLIERTGLSQGYIKLLLNNRGGHKRSDGSYGPPNPTLDVIWRLAQALELDPAYLIDPRQAVRSA